MKSIINNIDTSDIATSQFAREISKDTNEFNRGLCYNYVILGLGGIGAHVAEILGSISKIKSIVLFDNDVVELSNLNRTAFRYCHVGQSKVEAASEIISSRNVNVKVIAINDKFNKESVDEICKSNILRSFSGYKYIVIDCRDDYYGDYNLFKKIDDSSNCDNQIYRAAYDDMSITIDAHPEKHHVWGPGGYQVTPSHSIPARTAALMVVNLIRYSHNFPKLLDKPLTFKVEDILNHMMLGIAVRKLSTEKNIDIEEKIFNGTII